MGSNTTTESGADHFKTLSTTPGPKARVSLGVNLAVRDFGNAKVTATVTIECDQNEATINKAGEHAFYKALELCKDGANILDADLKKLGQ